MTDFEVFDSLLPCFFVSHVHFFDSLILNVAEEKETCFDLGNKLNMALI